MVNGLDSVPSPPSYKNSNSAVTFIADVTKSRLTVEPLPSDHFTNLYPACGTATTA